MGSSSRRARGILPTTPGHCTPGVAVPANQVQIRFAADLGQRIGRPRFRFAALPLKMRGATGSPIRAVAIVED
jgi:hypothetical protein